MVDWDQVERLRSKGWDWTRIAEDDRVQFSAESGAGEAGRQLRTLYYQRRSKSQRRGSEGGGGSSGAGRDDTEARPRLLLRIGYVVVPLFGIWALLTFALPWPGLIVPLIDVLLGLVVASFVLLFALFRATVRWERALRVPLVLGIVLGMVAAGTVTLVSFVEGCPNLAASAVAGEPNGWDRYANPSWASNGAPVFFFYGSIACPYCSASSWAMKYALQRFGTISGTSLTHSKIDDRPPSVPEVDLSGATIVSPYVSFAIYEGTDNTQITTPTLPSCTYQAYVSKYAAGIPFVVLGGQYVHTSSLVDPTKLVDASGAPLSPQTADTQMANQNGTTWNAAAPAMYTIEAILVKLNGGQPASVASDPSVASILRQLH